MTQTTPLPWRFYSEGNKPDSPRVFIDNEHVNICEVNTENCDGTDAALADAALIVTAVNAFEALRSNLGYIDYAANWADNDYSGDDVVEIRVTAKALRDIHELLTALLPPQPPSVICSECGGSPEDETPHEDFCSKANR